MHYSSFQLELLKRMGIDVWTLRDVEQEKRQSIQEPVEADNHASAYHHHLENDKDTSASGQLAEDIASLATQVAQCQKCQLCQSRNNTVFGVGQSPSKWMFVGEAPGQNEDQQGLPFVGRAGKLLDLMIRALGMERHDVYIANILKCRPPGNRDPLPEEIAQCEPYLLRQLDFIKPDVIVALGRISAQALLRTNQSLGKIRGQVYHYGDRKTPLIATYHPAYLLRNPEQKSRSWEDLWMAKTVVESSSSTDVRQ